MKKRRIIWLMCVHIVCSITVYGALRVYQQGYNTMHREPLAMASVSVQQNTAHVQVLHRIWEIPLPDEDSPTYFAAHILIRSGLQGWVYLYEVLNGIV